jgi:hypothetical protein
VGFPAELLSLLTPSFEKGFWDAGVDGLVEDDAAAAGTGAALPAEAGGLASEAAGCDDLGVAAGAVEGDAAS